MDTSALDFSVLEPLVFAALGAMVVLMAEVFFRPTRGVEKPSGHSPSPATGRSRGLFAIATVFLVLALGSALRLFASGTDAPWDQVFDGVR